MKKKRGGGGGPATQGHGELQQCTAAWLELWGAAGWEETGGLLKESPGGFHEFMAPSTQSLQRFFPSAGLNWFCHMLLASRLIPVSVNIQLCTIWFTNKFMSVVWIKLNG